MENSFSLNSYGRPSAAILPTPRGRGRGRGLVCRPIPTYPPGFLLDVIGDTMQEIKMDNFNNGYINTQNGPTITNPTMPTLNFTNPAPLMIQILPIMTSFATVKVAIQSSRCHSKCSQYRLPTAQVCSCYPRAKRTCTDCHPL